MTTNHSGLRTVSEKSGAVTGPAAATATSPHATRRPTASGSPCRRQARNPASTSTAGSAQAYATFATAPRSPTSGDSTGVGFELL
ncbi:hypothetical protein ACQEUU_01260 [Nonomuraea sp. CA-218870]|uniref:hypothetical protein n=1 Tax=Nonomuraea sp. CA-218870 TaxID=3239998 RepID=UPI003D906882